MTPTDRARLAGDLAAFALTTTEQAARLAAAGDRAGLFRLCMTAPIAQQAIVEVHLPTVAIGGVVRALARNTAGIWTLKPPPGWTRKGWRRRLKRGWVYPNKPAPRIVTWTWTSASASIERIPTRRPPLVIFDDLETP